MKNENKAKKQLINELKELRQWIAELEKSEVGHKQAEEEKYENLAESLSELIYRADPETFFPTYVNSAVEKFYGYTAEEWPKDPEIWERTIHPEDRERVSVEFTEAKRKMENRVVITYRIIKKDGAEAGPANLHYLLDALSRHRCKK